MKKITGVLFFLILLAFRTVCGQESGECGENVKYDISGSTIIFSANDSDKSAVWGSGCRTVIANNTAIKNVTVNQWISLTDGENLFNGLSSIEKMDLSGFQIPDDAEIKVNSAFSGCTALKELDLGSWTAAASSWNGTFDNCNSIETLSFDHTKNIYGTLPDRIRTGAWYYAVKSSVATDAYKIGTRVDAEGLFNNYVSTQMAGTWTMLAATVSFNGNGGARSDGAPMAAQYFPLNITLELKENEFTRTGYKFTRWTTEEDGSGDSYQDKQRLSFKEAKELTFYAQWEKIENVIVTFDANGGEGTMAEQTVQADTTTALNTNTFTRGGYIFTGWNTAADGSGTAYANGENITITDDLKLYAQWKAAAPDRPMIRFTDELPKTGFGLPRSQKPASIRYEPTGMELDIPSLKIASRIVNVEAVNGEYAVEWLGMDAGLLEGSAEPGTGNAVIAAHNTLDHQEYGPFAMIGRLQEGDHIFVRTDNDSMLVYEVYGNIKISADDQEALIREASRYPSTVTLLTCEDESVDGGYLSRRIVSAREILHTAKEQ